MSRIIVCVIFLYCLSSDLASATDSRIIGGKPALMGEIPWQVSLRRSYNDNHFCGGSIIAPNYVLTAAHCMYYIWGGLLPPFTVSAVVGQLDLPITSKSVYRNATDIIIHAGFNKTSMANDIAVIKVDSPFPLDDNPLIQVVTMRNSSIDSGTCLVSGWGVEQYDSEVISDVLLSAEVNLIPFDECSEKYGPSVNLSEGMLCAGHPNGETDACQGDSGGPLLCDGLLTGVISTGSGCGDPDYPGVYSDVNKYLPWITEVLREDEEGSTANPSNTSTTEIPTMISPLITVTLTQKETTDCCSNFSPNVKHNGLLFILMIVLHCTMIVWEK